jgi:hypothetical protein
MSGLPSGRVLSSKYLDDEADHELRIAFGFDGVLIDNEAEREFQVEGLEGFHQVEGLTRLAADGRWCKHLVPPRLKPGVRPTQEERSWEPNT